MPKFDPNKEYKDFVEITDATTETIYEVFAFLGEQIENEYHIPPEYYSKIRWCIMPPPTMEELGKADGSPLGFVSWKYEP